MAKGVAATVRGPKTLTEPPVVLGPECPTAVQGTYEGPTRCG